MGVPAGRSEGREGSYSVTPRSRRMSRFTGLSARSERVAPPPGVTQRTPRPTAAARAPPARSPTPEHAVGGDADARAARRRGGGPSGPARRRVAVQHRHVEDGVERAPVVEQAAVRGRRERDGRDARRLEHLHEERERDAEGPPPRAKRSSRSSGGSTSGGGSPCSTAGSMRREPEGRDRQLERDLALRRPPRRRTAAAAGATVRAGSWKNSASARSTIPWSASTRSAAGGDPSRQDREGRRRRRAARARSRRRRSRPPRRARAPPPPPAAPRPPRGGARRASRAARRRRRRGAPCGRRRGSPRIA